MDQHGTSAAVGILVMFSLIFACYLIYSTFSEPVNTVIDTMEAVDAEDGDNEVPSQIFPNLRLGWEIWVMVILSLAFVIVLAYAFRREEYGGY